MVSSGTVSSDASSFSSSLNNYSSEISSLSSIWKGTSHDSIVSKAESFVSEFNVISSELSSFASACAAYQDYLSYKTALATAQSNYNKAVSNNDTSNINLYSSHVSEYTSKMESLKESINSYLSSASATKLEAQSIENDFVNYYQYNYGDYAYYSGSSIASAGCGTTAMAMVLTYLKGEEIDPVETTQYSLEHGTYVSGVGTSWSYFSQISSDYGVSCEESSVSSDNIISALSSDKVVIMSMGPGTFTKGGHFIVLTGINDDGSISVADPSSEERSNTTYDVSTFVNEGKEMWSFC